MNSKKQRNRFLALLLSLCMVLTMVPLTAFAAAGTVAYIGNAGYDSLVSAVEAASDGETITLQADDSSAQQIAINKDLTIEMNGHNLTATAFKITGGNVVISDRSGGASIQSTRNVAFKTAFNSSVYATIYVEGGNLALEGVEVKGYQGTGGYLPKALAVGGGFVTINSGTFTGGVGGNSGGDAIYFDSGMLTIHSGLFQGGNGGGCGLSTTRKPDNNLVIRSGRFVGGRTDAAFWLGGNVTTADKVKEYFLDDSLGNYVVDESSFNAKDVTIGSGLFLSDLYTNPENGTADASNPGVLVPVEGGTVTLEPHVLGGTGGALTYQWYKDGTLIADQSGDTCTVTAKGDYLGDYCVVVTEDGVPANTITLYWKIAKAPTAYNVWVGGVQVTENNASDVLKDGTVSYNAATKTLTLNGAEITEGYYDKTSQELSGIYTLDDLKIVLADGSENKIALSADNASMAVGIAALDISNAYYNVSITGGGTLDISVSNGQFANMGIYSGNLSVSNQATVSMNIGTSSYSMLEMDCGALVMGDFSIENASLSSVGGAAGLKATGTAAIDSGSFLKLSGSTAGLVANDLSVADGLLAKGSTSENDFENLQDTVVDTVEGQQTITVSGSTALSVEIKSDPSYHSHPVCGGNCDSHAGHNALVYTPLDDGSGNLADGSYMSYGAYGYMLKNGGNYYLTADVELSDTLYINQPVNLCLNGHKLTVNTDKAIELDGDGSLNLCDCGTGGSITATAEGSTGIYHGAGSLHIYGGSVSGDEKGIWSVNTSDVEDIIIHGGEISCSKSYGAYYSLRIYNVNVTVSGGTLSGSVNVDHDLTISGGAVNGSTDVGGDFTMTDGSITGRVTVNSHTEGKGNFDMSGGKIEGTVSIDGEGESLRISGDAVIQSTGNDYYDTIASNNSLDVEISGGTIISPSGYALNFMQGSTKIYLSDNPTISGKKADIRILQLPAAKDAVLRPHAKDDSSNVYTGGGLTLSALAATEGYLVQGVTDKETAAKFSLATPGYELEYEQSTSAIKMRAKTFTVTLPNGAGYTVTPESGSSSPVKYNGSYSFTVNIADKYYQTDAFEVKAGSTVLTPDSSGVYTISNIQADTTVSVEGVALDNEAPTATITLGKNSWKTFLNTITFGLFFKDTQTVSITAEDTGSGIAKIEYFFSDTAYEDEEALETATGWQDYADAFSIQPNSKLFIYAKVTDKVGNVTYVNSDGIVLYTDAEQDTAEISFTRKGADDVTAKVKLNGNTVAGIKCGDDTLTPETDYTIGSDGTVTFKASWLGTLAAGDYTLTVSYNPLGEEYQAKDGNAAPDTTSIALKVQKMQGSVTGLSDLSKVYDGNSVNDITYIAPSKGTVTVEYKAQDAGDSTYATTKPSAVGKYTVCVTVAADDDYTEASTTADFAITYLDAPDQNAFTVSGTKGDNGWYKSDVTITPPDGYTISDSLNGNYADSFTINTTANVAVYLKNSQGQMTDSISIEEIKIDKSAPTLIVTGNTMGYQESDMVSINAADSVSGVVKVEVSKDGGAMFEDITASYQQGYTVTANGTYIFRVTDAAGWETTRELDYDHIDGETPVVAIDSGGYTGGSWTNQSVTLEPKNTAGNLGTDKIEYKIDGGDWQTYTAPIIVSDDTDADGITCTFRITAANSKTSEEKSITVKKDSVAPDGDITIKENSIKRFFNTISFGLFFKENVDVAISGTDALSGVSSIEYYRSEAILTEEDVKALADSEWTEYAGKMSETAVDAKKFVYYAKITDNAGNVTLFGSDGVTFDLTDPAVSGVTNGETYCTTQKVTATDANLETVTVNGSAPSGEILLAGNRNEVYTIIATDKAGNSTTVTVNMKPIASLANPIAGLTAENVTSSDKPAIEQVKAAAQAVDTTNATEAEKAELENIISNCDALLKVIKDTADEIKEVTDDVNSYDLDTVKSSDKDDIEALAERIDNRLASDNLTSVEKDNLSSLKDTANTLLEKISETMTEMADVFDTLNGYAVETVKSSDKGDIEALIDQIDAFLNGNNLTEDERDMLEAAKDAANALLDKISEAADAAASEAVKDTGDITADNVILDDKDTLKEALKDLTDALESNGGNYTETEQAEIQEKIDRINEALTAIENAEATVGLIEALPDTEDIKVSDEAAIKAALQAYNALTKHEKELVGAQLEAKLDAAQAALEQAQEDAKPDGAPQTGDSNALGLWVALTFVSGGTFLILTIKRKKQSG